MASPTQQTPEQWNQSVQAIIVWLDPHVTKDDPADSHGSPSTERTNPASVRKAIDLMRSVATNGNESYANPLVHAHYLYRTNQFSRIKISRFLAQEYESPYVEDRPILAYYLHLDSIHNKSIIESLRMYFTRFKLDTPSNSNELNNLMSALATKYCQDNQEIRNKHPHLNNGDGNNQLSIADPKLSNNKIDSKTNIFLGDVHELTKIYEQCMASQSSLHGTVAIGRIRPTENKFIETLNGELGDDNIQQFNESAMRQIFQGIKTRSLREERIESAKNSSGGNSSSDGDIVYNNDDQTGNKDSNPTENSGGCCIVM